MPILLPKFRRRAAALFALAITPLLAGQAAVADYKVGSLDITRPWARATPKGASTGAAYLTATNNGGQTERLSCASSTAAAKCQIHEMAMDNNGVMKMRPVEGGLAIKPGQTVTLKPGGYHIMLEGVKAPLKAGDKIEATLATSSGTSAKVEFPVAAVGALAPGSSAGGGVKKMRDPGMMPMQK